jgi:hypothetical protein
MDGSLHTAMEAGLHIFDREQPTSFMRFDVPEPDGTAQ